MRKALIVLHSSCFSGPTPKAGSGNSPTSLVLLRSNLYLPRQPRSLASPVFNILNLHPFGISPIKLCLQEPLPYVRIR